MSGGNIFAGTFGDGIFLSTNNGTSWTAVNSGLPDYILVYSLKASGNAIFAATSGGSVFLSTNNGTNWTVVNSSLPNAGILTLAMSESNIFAGTNGSGIWRRSISEIINSANTHPQREIPHQAQLKINPPGRPGSALSVEFTLTHSEHVTVNMYDLSGKGISSLVNRQLDAGAYRYSWNTHSFARGCYAIKLKAGSTTCMKLVQISH
jgi:hypothetical protein